MTYVDKTSYFAQPVHTIAYKYDNFIQKLLIL